MTPTYYVHLSENVVEAARKQGKVLIKTTDFTEAHRVFSEATFASDGHRELSLEVVSDDDPYGREIMHRR